VLGRDQALEALRRLEAQRLIRRRRLRAGIDYRLTRRGAAELALQRMLWRLAAVA
jgi:DNA-binding PadR family transcriptional regulator